MEQRHKVRLTTSNTFVLESEEVKRLYTYLALFQYRYLRIPDYKEHLLFESLEKDFKKFYIEMQNQTERDPNNLTLNRILAFFDTHYKHIKKINNECRASDS